MYFMLRSKSVASDKPNPTLDGSLGVFPKKEAAELLQALRVRYQSPLNHATSGG